MEIDCCKENIQTGNNQKHAYLIHLHTLTFTRMMNENLLLDSNKKLVDGTVPKVSRHKVMLPEAKRSCQTVGDRVKTLVSSLNVLMVLDFKI